MDPIVVAARGLVSEALDVLRRAVDGLSEEALDWEPAGPHTNSIAVLTTHALGATRLLLSLALGLQEPDRDRDAEFAATSGGADRLLGMVDQVGAECLSLLDDAPADVDWSAMRSRRGAETERPAAYWMLHALDHLRGHADEAALTRHVWEEFRG